MVAVLNWRLKMSRASGSNRFPHSVVADMNRVLMADNALGMKAAAFSSA